MKTATAKLTPGQWFRAVPAVPTPEAAVCVFSQIKAGPFVPLFDFETLWENQVSFGCCAMFPCSVRLPHGSIAGAQRGTARRSPGGTQHCGGGGTQPCCPAPNALWGAWLLPRGFLVASQPLPFWLFSHLSLFTDYWGSLNGQIYCQLNRGGDVLAMGSHRDGFAANEVGDILQALLCDSREQCHMSAGGRGSAENLLGAHESRTKSGWLLDCFC